MDDNTYLVAFCACQCIHMAIPTTHPDCAVWRAIWGERGYVCTQMSKGALTRAGRLCVAHRSGATAAMQVASNTDRVKIYGKGR